MRSFHLFFLIVIAVLSIQVKVYAQPELQALFTQADEAMKQADYPRAINLYYQAIKLKPNDIVLRRDMAYAYFLNGEVDQSNTILNEIIDSGMGDEETYQLGAAIARSQKNVRRSLSLINSGLKKHPQSGILLNAKGLHYQYVNPQKPKLAIPFFLEGIQAQPRYANNYYSLAKIMMQLKKYDWAIIYAESYILIDNNNPRAVEIRRLLYDAYHALVANVDVKSIPKLQKKTSMTSNSDFAEDWRRVLNDNKPVMADGFHIENLIVYRTRVVIQWMNSVTGVQHSLLQYWSRMIADGHFDAYNQLLFGAIDDSGSYARWSQQYSDDITKMMQWWQNNDYLPHALDPQYRP